MCKVCRHILPHVRQFTMFYPIGLCTEDRQMENATCNIICHIVPCMFMSQRVDVWTVPHVGWAATNLHKPPQIATSLLNLLITTMTSQKHNVMSHPNETLCHIGLHDKLVAFAWQVAICGDKPPVLKVPWKSGSRGCKETGKSKNLQSKEKGGWDATIKHSNGTLETENHKVLRLWI